jgi:hypothetical protein
MIDVSIRSLLGEAGHSSTEMDALCNRLAQDIARRRKLATERGLDFELVAHGERHVSQDTEADFDDLQLYRDKIRVHLVMAPRRYTRLGLLPQLADRLRRELHGLPVFYCNLLGQRQILFNDRLLHLLASFAQRLKVTEDVADQVQALQRRIEALERRHGEKNP